MPADPLTDRQIWAHLPQVRDAATGGPPRTNITVPILRDYFKDGNGALLKTLVSLSEPAIPCSIIYDGSHPNQQVAVYGSRYDLRLRFGSWWVVYKLLTYIY
jgi:hypothetical protein